MTKQTATMPFWEHLEELRRTIFKIIAAWAVGTGLAWMVYIPAFNLLIKPTSSLSDLALRFDTPLAPFMMKIHVSMALGLVITLPFVFRFVWTFLRPGLKPGEQRLAVWAFTAGTGFFFTGAAFAYAMLPFILKFLTSPSLVPTGVIKEWDIITYLAFALRMTIAFGIMFELPVIIFILVTLRLVNTLMLRNLRPYAIVTAFLLAAILTPPDILSQVILGVPLILLYELSIWVGYLQEKRLQKQQTEPASTDSEPFASATSPEPAQSDYFPEDDPHQEEDDDFAPYAPRSRECLEDLPELFNNQSLFKNNDQEQET